MGLVNVIKTWRSIERSIKRGLVNSRPNILLIYPNINVLIVLLKHYFAQYIIIINKIVQVRAFKIIIVVWITKIFIYEIISFFVVILES